MKNIRWFLGFVLALALMVPQASLAQNYTFTIAHVLEPEHSVHIGAIRFKQVAEEMSDGRIKVNLFPGGMLGDTREMALQLRNGAIFGMIDSTTKFVNFVPEYALLDMPFLARDASSAFGVMDSPTASEVIYAKSINAGFRLIHGWEVSFRHIYTKKGPILSTGDLEGLKIRTIPSPTFINLFKAFGASPTPMEFGEVYTSLEQGVVDGAENDVLTYLSTKHYEVVPHLALTNHMMLLNSFFVSEKIWNTLPEDIREIVVAASLEARKATTSDRDRKLQSAFDELRSAGVQISEPDLKPFVAAANQTRKYFVDQFGSELVEEFAKLGAN